MIQEDYVSVEIAKLLKEKGFDGECDYLYVKGNIVRAQGHRYNWNKGETIFTDYKNECSAPTLQMAMKWLREEKDIQIEISIVGTDTWESPTKWMYGFRCQTQNVIDRRNADFLSYEEACEAAIKYCLKNLI